MATLALGAAPGGSDAKCSAGVRVHAMDSDNANSGRQDTFEPPISEKGANERSAVSTHPPRRYPLKLRGITCAVVLRLNRDSSGPIGWGHRSLARMNRRTKLVWLLMIACAVGAFFGGRALLRRYAGNKAATTFARFSRCLVGSEPLGNETPSRRLRRIELGVLERKLGQVPAAADAEWPARCDRYAHDLDRALPDAFHGPNAVDDAQGIMGPLDQLRADLRKGEIAAQDFLSPIERVWSASRIKGTIGDVSDVPLPPAPAQLVGIGAAPPISDDGIVHDLEPSRSR